jgi:hypothetical protein
MEPYRGVAMFENFLGYKQVNCLTSFSFTLSSKAEHCRQKILGSLAKSRMAVGTEAGL